jgi:hypothetical protein
MHVRPSARYIPRLCAWLADTGCIVGSPGSPWLLATTLCLYPVYTRGRSHGASCRSLFQHDRHRPVPGPGTSNILFPYTQGTIAPGGATADERVFSQQMAERLSLWSRGSTPPAASVCLCIWLPGASLPPLERRTHLAMGDPLKRSPGIPCEVRVRVSVTSTNRMVYAPQKGSCPARWSQASRPVRV